MRSAVVVRAPASEEHDGMAGARTARRRVLAAVAALALAAAVVVLVTRAESGEGRPSAARGCRSAVSTGALPAWARAGFFGPQPPRVPHVLGTHGRIVAILFGGTLHAPPSPDLRNKILWVSPTGGEEPLRIDATRADGRAHARRVIADGPGPSYVDLPSAGCWRLVLSWGAAGTERDSLDLAYAPPSS
jgi:hypothetical protein